MIPSDRFAPSANGAPQRFVSDADQLVGEFQLIEQAWKQAEDTIAATRVPIDVRVKIDSGYLGDGQDAFVTYLSFEKVKGNRRICFVREDHDCTDGSFQTDCRPVVEMPVDTRVEMFDHFEALYRQATAVVKSYVPKLKAARLKFEATLALIDL